MSQSQQPNPAPNQPGNTNSNVGRSLVVLAGIALTVYGAFYARSIAQETGAFSSSDPSHVEIKPQVSDPIGGTTAQPQSTLSSPNTDQSAPPVSGGTEPDPSGPGTSVQPAETILDAPSAHPSSKITTPANSGASVVTGSVVGMSPDGKALKIHITGSIAGAQPGTGTVVVSFFNPDKTPMPARDPASGSGGAFQLAATLQISSDPAPVDITVEAPLEMFTAMVGATYTCKAVVSGKTIVESEHLPVVSSTVSGGNSKQ